jgi:hypothetical protein
MRKIILAAAFAVTFTLPLAAQAQQAGAPGTQGGPPTSGSFSVQGQPQGSALGPAQTFYGPADQTANSGPQPTAQPAGTSPATGTASTDQGNTAPATPPATPPAVGVGGAGTAGTQTQPEANTQSNRTVFEGPASEDPQVELARLRAEVDRLRAEQGQSGTSRDSARMQGTGGSGSTQAILDAQPVASATFQGRVRKASKQAIEIIDRETGETYVLHVNKGTRVRRGEQRASVAGIREGSEVRASFDLISGRTYAKRIDVLGKGRH